MKKVKPIALSTHLKLPATQPKVTKKTDDKSEHPKSKVMKATSRSSQSNKSNQHDKITNNDNTNADKVSSNFEKTNDFDDDDDDADSADEWMQPVRDDFSDHCSASKDNSHSTSNKVDSKIDDNSKRGNNDEEVNDDNTLACNTTSNSHRNAARRSVQKMNETERELAGELVRVQFTLPDGSTCENTFYMGETIQHMKCMLDSEKGLAYDATSLYLNNELLLDPLSLNDLPFSADKLNLVEVKVRK